MKSLSNSNFSSIQEIIKDIDFNYDEENAKNIEYINNCWQKTVGEKISRYSKPAKYSKDEILTILCSDSYTANELYFVKEKLINIMNENIKDMGIKIKDIKFDYKTWKEQDNE